MVAFLMKFEVLTNALTVDRKKFQIIVLLNETENH